MGYSSRKPYYNLGMSQREFFGGSSRFLKQSLDKESMFEKPYLDLEYPQMHLRLPEPSWPSWKPSTVRGPFGEVRKSLLARYIFPPPDCGLARESSTAWAFHWWNSCGDVSTIAFQADSFFKTDWNWTYSLSSEDISLSDLTIKRDSKSISISTDVPGTYGTVLVCGTGYGGQVPLLWETTYREGEDYRLFLGPPRLWNQIAGQEAAVHCCEEVMFDCDACVSDPTMAWDEGTSAETIGQSESVTVAIIGLNTPFTWSVSGKGFTLANATTIGQSNTLITNAEACGPATIIVVGCDSTSVTGYVRCTEGEWIHDGYGPASPSPPSSLYPCWCSTGALGYQVSPVHRAVGSQHRGGEYTPPQDCVQGVDPGGYSCSWTDGFSCTMGAIIAGYWDAGRDHCWTPGCWLACDLQIWSCIL